MGSQHPEPSGTRRGVRARKGDGPRASAVEPTFSQRLEYKYLIDPSRIDELRESLRPFARPDSYAARRRDHRYTVCSLYLDSRDLLLYRQTACGEKDRFKLRVRTYADDPDEPAFFEVKRKLHSVVHKRRVGLPRQAASAVLADRTTDVLAGLVDRRQADLDYFLHHATRVHARPVVRVKYQREAWEATGNEPVRVTIDTDLEHQMSFGDDLRQAGGHWTRSPLPGTIIEIKFTERFPWWIEAFVRRFGLRQRPVPKYVLALQPMLADGRRATLVAEGFEPPHPRI